MISDLSAVYKIRWTSSLDDEYYIITEFTDLGFESGTFRLENNKAFCSVSFVKFTNKILSEV